MQPNTTLATHTDMRENILQGLLLEMPAIQPFYHILLNSTSIYLKDHEQE